MASGKKTAAEIMYGSPPGGATREWATMSYYTRRRGSLRDDPERLAQCREEERQILEATDKRTISAALLHDAFSALRDHEIGQRGKRGGPDARTPEQRELESKAQYEHAYREGFDQLRLEEGSQEAAAKVWDRMRAGLDILTKECPLIAARANAPAVAADMRTIRFLASLPETPQDTPPPPPAAA